MSTIYGYKEEIWWKGKGQPSPEMFGIVFMGWAPLRNDLLFSPYAFLVISIHFATKWAYLIHVRKNVGFEALFTVANVGGTLYNLVI